MTAQQSRFNAHMAAHVMRLEERVAELEAARAPRTAATATPPPCMRVDQVLCAAGPVDAVTNQALAYRALFRRWGWAGEDYAPVQAPGMARGAIRPLHELAAAARRRAGAALLGLRRRARAGAGRRGREACWSPTTSPRRTTSGPRPGRGGALRAGPGAARRAGRGGGALAGVSEFNAARAGRAERADGDGDPGAVRSPARLGARGAGLRTARGADRSCSSGASSPTSARTW